MGSGLDPIPVAIALGSNLGARDAHLAAAIAALSACVDNLKASTFHETAPVGVGDQPPFLNAAVTGTTRLSAATLLGELLAIERRFGRERPYWGAARTLDLDLILYGPHVIDEPGLSVPHPRFRDRLFVLEPLAEVAATWVDPVTGYTVDQLRLAQRAREASQPQK